MIWPFSKIRDLNNRMIELQESLEDTRAAYESLLNSKVTAKSVVDAIVGDGFRFFDYAELDEQERTRYFDQAQYILRSDVFKNEVARLNAEFAEWALKKAPDFSKVEAMRYQISGINLLKERFESIPDPKTYKRSINEDI